MIQRAVSVTFSPGLILPCCSAEDLLVMKAFAGPPRDWLDAESIAVRQKVLDVDYVQATVLHLLGIDRLKLTYRFKGRDFRLTDVAGNVQHRLLA